MLPAEYPAPNEHKTPISFLFMSSLNNEKAIIEPAEEVFA
jgi:hypothetical protein